MEPEILFHDNHLLVIAKPAGLLAQADETGDIDVLTLCKDWLKTTFHKPGNVFLGLVHRLDRPASGLMVLARTSKAAERLSRQFEQRTVQKRYLALVEGELRGEGTWRDHLLKEDRKVRVVSAGVAGAKAASLSWRAIATAGGCTLVDIELHTGRAHQIRLQFASRGHALLGDLRYGAQRKFDGRNLALHAYTLSFKHPTQEKQCSWTLLPPATWAGYFPEAIAALE